MSLPRCECGRFVRTVNNPKSIGWFKHGEHGSEEGWVCPTCLPVWKPRDGLGRGPEAGYCGVLAASPEERGQAMTDLRTTIAETPVPGGGTLQQVLSAWKQMTRADFISPAAKTSGDELSDGVITAIVERIGAMELSEAEVLAAAQGTRHHRFERTRRLSAFDPAVPPTENELSDARACLKAAAQARMKGEP